jgi:hypothetical protein
MELAIKKAMFRIDREARRASATTFLEMPSQCVGASGNMAQLSARTRCHADSDALNFSSASRARYPG